MPDSGTSRALWLQRTIFITALALMAWAIMRPGGTGLHGTGLAISIAFGLASVCWVGWVFLGPHGNTPALIALTAGSALSGAVLLVLYPSLAVYWFTFWGCVHAGVNMSAKVGVAITGGSLAVLVAGWAEGQPSILGAFAAAAFVGYVLGRNRQHYLGVATAATRAADQREHEAAQAERDRIARDLHDVLGHSLTGVSLQIESAAAALETRSDASAALSYLERAGELVRTGQHEAVAAVSTLRAGSGEAVDVEAKIAGLTGIQCASLTATQLIVTGIPRPVPALAAMALYRVVQESLTNAAKHGSPDVVQVQLEYLAGAVSVRVDSGLPEDATAAIGSGQGIAGMRDRMAAVGGTLTAGPVGAAWRVDARVCV